MLEYGCPIWSPFYTVHINKLEQIQKKCLRTITRRFNLGRSVSTYAQRLARFHILPLEARRNRYDLLYLHKILHAGVDSPALLSLINFNTNLRTRTPNVFSLQVFRNNTSYYNPIIRMCRLYNEMAKLHGNEIDVFDSRFSIFKNSVTQMYLNFTIK